MTRRRKMDRAIAIGSEDHEHGVKESLDGRPDRSSRKAQ
jgi:hypothetical protein